MKTSDNTGNTDKLPMTESLDFGDEFVSVKESAINQQHLKSSYQPLAAKLRPENLAQYIGQQHILGEGTPLRHAIEQGHCHSLIFWGPPGTGKTTLAEIIAQHSDAAIERISAVTSGIKDIRLAIENAKQRIHGKSTDNKNKTVLFVDEVHRFNKAQQDAFLPHIEDGTIIFIGATTENPAFELNRAILSRARVYTLKKLNHDELLQVLLNAVDFYKNQQNICVHINKDVKQSLIKRADGDARRLINLVENCVDSLTSISVANEQQGTQVNNIEITLKLISQISGSKIAVYDKGGDAFYDLISAFHKSVRGSSPDAALYWYARILNAGGDPLYVARRLLAIASEDIGNADPRAMQLAINAWDTFQRVGPSEGERAIAQAAVYLALAPKSNAVYTAFKQALAIAKQTSELDVPDHLKNATSELTKSLGHGQEYRYAHDEANAFAAGEDYFPQALAQSHDEYTQFYQPTDRGLEKQLKEKLNYLKQLNKESHEQRYK